MRTCADATSLSHYGTDIANAWIQVYLVTKFLGRADRVLKHLALAHGSYTEHRSHQAL
jgi:hypothetical protein